MTNSPFQGSSRHKLINIEAGVSELRSGGDASEYAGLTAMIRKFAEGDYRRWQKDMAKGAAANTETVKTTNDAGEEVEEVKEKVLGASWENNRDLLFTIGVVEWNFKLESGELAPVDTEHISLLDADVSTCIRNEILRLNPCLWENLSDRDLRRIGIGVAAKNA